MGAVDELDVEAAGGRYLLRLRVSPGAARDGIIGVHGGALKLRVIEPPEKGRANKGVLRVMAKALDLPPRDLELVAGKASRDKRVAVRFDGTAEELKRRLAPGTSHE